MEQGWGNEGKESDGVERWEWGGGKEGKDGNEKMMGNIKIRKKKVEENEGNSDGGDREAGDGARKGWEWGVMGSLDMGKNEEKESDGLKKEGENDGVMGRLVMGKGREGLVMGRRWEVQGDGKEGKESDEEE